MFDIETNLVDLSGHSPLKDLYNASDDDPDLIMAGDRIKKEITKPRTNLGGNGPPGRTD